MNRMLPDTFQIMHAENGRTAIQKAAEFHPHIVMMDVRMPGIQGLEALKEIKAHNPGVKMVLITAYEYFDYAKQALSLGVHEYLVKPAKREQIAAVLKRLVDEIAEDRRERNEQLAVRDKFFQLLPLAETELALHFMSDQVNETEVSQLADILKLPAGKGCAIVLAFPEIGDQKKKVYDTVKTLTHDIAKDRCGAVVSSMVHSHMAVFLLAGPQAGDEALREGAAQLGAKLAESLANQCGITISVGIGSVQSEAAGIRRSYYEAVFASKFEDKWGSLYRFEDLKAADGAGAEGLREGTGRRKHLRPAGDQADPGRAGAEHDEYAGQGAGVHTRKIPGGAVAGGCGGACSSESLLLQQSVQTADRRNLYRLCDKASHRQGQGLDEKRGAEPEGGLLRGRL
ncbi:Transcriptional regulatory protein ZraR [Paenibacillus sp. P1XP2]|nr:Transcriptional regulatory protein ZraR [Paenibacillus sp. P1XP2]